MPGQILRACATCGRPFKPRHARHRHCPKHEPERSPTTQTRPSSSTERQQVRLTVLNRDGWRCQIALPGCEGEATVADHIVPAAEGGLYEPSNLRAACVYCNSVLGGRQSSALKHGLDGQGGPADAGGGRTAPAPHIPTRLH